MEKAALDLPGRSNHLYDDGGVTVSGGVTARSHHGQHTRYTVRLNDAAALPQPGPVRGVRPPYVRAETLADLEGLEERAYRYFEAGALASGCELSITPESEPYSEFRTDELCVQHAESLGRDFNAPPEQATMNRASTDMGNVSQVAPAIHPYIGLGCFPAANHQPSFAAHCVGEAANQAVYDGAAPLALTALDYLV